MEKFDRRLWDLLDDMGETLAHYNGVGLAAVQVGILLHLEPLPLAVLGPQLYTVGPGDHPPLAGVGEASKITQIQEDDKAMAMRNLRTEGDDILLKRSRPSGRVIIPHWPG